MNALCQRRFGLSKRLRVRDNSGTSPAPVFLSLFGVALHQSVWDGSRKPLNERLCGCVCGVFSAGGSRHTPAGTVFALVGSECRFGLLCAGLVHRTWSVVCKSGCCVPVFSGGLHTGNPHAHATGIGVLSKANQQTVRAYPQRLARGPHYLVRSHTQTSHKTGLLVSCVCMR